MDDLEAYKFLGKLDNETYSFEGITNPQKFSRYIRTIPDNIYIVKAANNDWSIQEGDWLVWCPSLECVLEILSDKEFQKRYQQRIG